MPRSDNAALLRQAAQRRSRDARGRAEKTITAAQRSTDPVTIAGIARAADVSRSWLYTQTDLVATIDAMKSRTPSPVRTGRQPASSDSLQRRLDAAQHRLTQLRAQNRDLTRRLETAHSEIRRLRIASPGIDGTEIVSGNNSMTIPGTHSAGLP